MISDLKCPVAFSIPSPVLSINLSLPRITRKPVKNLCRYPVLNDSECRCMRGKDLRTSCRLPAASVSAGNFRRIGLPSRVLIRPRSRNIERRQSFRPNSTNNAFSPWYSTKCKSGLSDRDWNLRVIHVTGYPVSIRDDPLHLG